MLASDFLGDLRGTDWQGLIVMLEVQCRHGSIQWSTPNVLLVKSKCFHPDIPFSAKFKSLVVFFSFSWVQY